MLAAAAFITGLSLLVVPATSSIPVGPTPLQLLARVAALEAEEASIESSQPLACAALFSQPSVEVNQPVALAWGSVGATTSTSTTQSMWTPAGSTMVSIQTPGPWAYSFTFYGASGTNVTCKATITVTQ